MQLNLIVFIKFRWRLYFWLAIMKIVVSSYIIQDILSFVIYNEQNETRLSINK